MTTNQKSPSYNAEDLIIPFEATKKLLDAYIEHKQLFLFKHKGIMCIFRALTIAELDSIKTLSKVCNSIFIEDWILEKVIIYSNFTDTSVVAGITTKIAKAIVKKSDSGTEETYIALLESEREKVNTLDYVSQSLINRVFPTINIHNLSFFNQARLLAVSEIMLNTKIGIGANKKNTKPTKGIKPKPGFTSLGGEPSNEASRILAPENADKPDFNRDNAALRDA